MENAKQKKEKVKKILAPDTKFNKIEIIDPE